MAGLDNNSIIKNQSQIKMNEAHFDFDRWRRRGPSIPKYNKSILHDTHENSKRVNCLCANRPNSKP